MKERILLFDELGKEQEFIVIATFGMDDEDYAALMPEIGRASCRERV